MRVAVPTRESGWAGLFTAAFASSRNGMTLVDAQRRQVDVNGAFLNLVGYRRADLLGRPLWEIVAGGPLVTPAEGGRLLTGRGFSGGGAVVAPPGAPGAPRVGAAAGAGTGC